ncbi:hypothetical protein [Roseivirga sp.]|uniref:hypothetical protein n=1 Tax=Roseivirga sp. TaxID=1964215 RepID=UPI003B5249ED
MMVKLLLNRKAIWIQLLFLSFTTSLSGQQKADTVIILFKENPVNKVMTLEKVYSQPDKQYPLDQIRKYIINQFYYCKECKPSIQPITFAFHFINTPKKLKIEKPYDDYFKVSKEELVNYRLLDSNWFNHTPWEEVRKLILQHRKVLYLIDESYLINNQFVAMKVEFDDWTVSH